MTYVIREFFNISKQFEFVISIVRVRELMCHELSRVTAKVTQNLFSTVSSTSSGDSLLCIRKI
jgi:hypothetical protein